MRSIIFIWILINSILIVNSSAQKQQLKFTRINILEDASLGQVNFIAEDKYGFIWFSEESNGALARFDGYNIKRYKHIPGEENSLGGPYPECLLIDKDGYIWIGLMGYGLDRFNPLTETFKHYRHDPENSNSLSDNSISALVQAEDGKIYIATFGGLDVLDPETDQFEHFKYNPADSSSLSSNEVREIYEDRQGTIWIGTGWFFENARGGLNRFDKESGTFKRYMADPSNPTALSNDRITALFEDSQGVFWIGTGDALYSMDRQKETFTGHRADPTNPNKLAAPLGTENFYGVTFISEDLDGHLWIGGAGCNVYDRASKTITYYGDNTDPNGTFIENSSWCMHVSSNGLIWLSTQPGVYQVDPYNFVIPRIDGFISSYLFESDSVTWIGSNDGLVRMNHHTGSKKVWIHDPSDPNSISDNTIMSLLVDDHGFLWIGTNNGLNKLNPLDGRVRRFMHNPLDESSISSNTIRDLYQGENDVLWIGTVNGLNKIDQVTGTCERHRLRDGRSSNVTSISCIVGGDKNTLWIGEFFTGSVFRYNFEKDERKFYSLANGVNDLYRDHLGVIWAATPSGLYRYNDDQDRFEALTHAPMVAMIEDLDKNLWACSNSDVFRINNDRDNIVQYNGVYSRRTGALNAIKAGGYLQRDGSIIIGEAQNYFVFDPEKIITPGDTSWLYFTNLWLGEDLENATLSHSIFENQELNLPYNHNTFALTFTEIDPRSPKRNKIKYILENYDLEWRECFAEEKVTYLNVPPGRYTFKMRASNSRTGDWRERELLIGIAPPWWMTWWSYLGYLLFAVAGIWLIHTTQKKRTIRMERERIRDKELAQAKEVEKAYTMLKATQSQLIHSEKMASLGELTAGIAHEIQNPLNFVNNFSELNEELIAELKEELQKGNLEEVRNIVEDLFQNEEKIKQHGKRAEGIVKSMLQHSRINSGQKEPTDINSLCDEYLRLAYHGFRAKDKSLNAEIKANFDSNLPKIKVVPQDIGRVLLNLINNAFYSVHEKAKGEANGYKPLVTVSTTKVGDKIEIKVTDNGRGIPEDIKNKIFQPFFTTKPTGQGTGLGLSLAYDIVKAHGGDLKLESKGAGTTFIIELAI